MATYKKEEDKRIYYGYDRIGFLILQGHPYPHAPGASWRGFSVLCLLLPCIYQREPLSFRSPWRRAMALAILLPPGEAESGSAGVQPDKEYPGRRCADGASGPWGKLQGSSFSPSDTRVMPWKTHRHSPARRLLSRRFSLSFWAVAFSSSPGDLRRPAPSLGLSQEVPEDLIA